MAKTDHAQKAAETRAKNAELAQKEAEQLANETKGELNCLELEISNNSLNDAGITEGQGAKKKALKNVGMLLWRGKQWLPLCWYRVSSVENKPKQRPTSRCLGRWPAAGGAKAWVPLDWMIKTTH